MTTLLRCTLMAAALATQAYATHADNADAEDVSALHPQRNRTVPADGVMGDMTEPTLDLYLHEGDRFPKLTLPASAPDRARLVVRMNGSHSTYIDDGNIEEKATLGLRAGDEYRFMFQKEKNMWRMTKAAKVELTSSQLDGGVIPPMRTPSTWISVPRRRAVTSALELPVDAKPDDRITIHNYRHHQAVSVEGPGLFERWTIPPGARVQFEKAPLYGWQPYTQTLDLLPVFGDKAVKRLGDFAVRARIAHDVALTNKALADSRVGIWIRDATALYHPIAGTRMSDVLDALQSDPRVRHARLAAEAHAVYYLDAVGDLGPDGACGMAWLGSPMNWRWAYSTVDIDCNSSVLAHEVGHMLGVWHGNAPSAVARFARGYPLAKTLLAGDKRLLYSNPDVLDPSDGTVVGKRGEFDAASHMNSNAADLHWLLPPS